MTTRRQCFPHPHFIRTYTALQHSHPNRRTSGCYDIIPPVNHLIRFNIIECKLLPRWECASLRKEWVHMVIVLDPHPMVIALNLLHVTTSSLRNSSLRLKKIQLWWCRQSGQNWEYFTTYFLPFFLNVRTIFLIS